MRSRCLTFRSHPFSLSSNAARAESIECHEVRMADSIGPQDGTRDAARKEFLCANFFALYAPATMLSYAFSAKARRTRREPGVRLFSAFLGVFVSPMKIRVLSISSGPLGTARILLTCGDGALPRPNWLLPDPNWYSADVAWSRAANGPCGELVLI